MALPAILLGGGSSILTRFLGITFIVGIIARVIAGLGFTVVSFVGLDLGLDALDNQLTSYLSGFPIEAKALLDMAGVTTMVKWVVGAYAFKVALGVGRSVFMRTSSVPSST